MPNDQPNQTNPTGLPPVSPQPATPPVAVPPMPEQSMEVPMTDGSAAPQDMPPVVTGGGPTTKKKFGGGKFIPTILGLLILTGAVSAGAYLVKQNQDIRNRAAIPCDPPCASDEHCNLQTGLCVADVVVETEPPTNTCQYTCLGNATCAGSGGTVVSGTCGTGTVCCNIACKKLLDQCTPGGSECCSPYTCASTGYCLDQTACKSEGQTCGIQYDCCAGLMCTNGTCTTTEKPPTTQSCTTVSDCEVFCNGKECCPDPQNCQTGCSSSFTCINKLCKCTNKTNSCSWPAGDTGWSACNSSNGDNTCAPNTNKCYQTRVCPDSNISEYQIRECDCGGTITENPQCTTVKAYTSDWTALTTAQLATQKSGTTVYFTVVGAGATFTQARFRITGDSAWRTPVTTKKSGTNEFYMEYTMPATAGTVTVEAQVGTAANVWY